MKHSKQELDAMIDAATAGIRNEDIDAAAIESSAARVWARVMDHAAENSYTEAEGINNMSNNSEKIHGCDDFQSLIPAYLDGKLSTGRKLLLEDHSNECVPCRREIKQQRALAEAGKSIFVAPRAAERTTKKKVGSSRWTTARVVRWSAAAAVVVCVGIAGMFAYERLDLSGRTLAATVENTNGSLFVVSDEQSRPLAAGEEIKKGEHVRTAKDSTAMLRLADGSSVELSERSEFSVSENMRGVTIKLDRGDVIVEAAKQKNGRLYVQTPDSLVSVKGTIFAVESGTKGSRVSVVEGEVQVNHGGKDETLLPGDQTTTTPTLAKTPVQQNFAWSKNAAKYANLATELAKLRQAVNQNAARPGVRYSSKLVDLIPENTVFYAALPNLAESLAESQRIIQERIKQNPALAEWKKTNKDGGFGIDEGTMTMIREFGSQLGDEIVVAASMDAKGEPSGVLVLGEVKDAANFRGFLDSNIARLSKEAGKSMNISIVDDPATAAKTATGKELYVWINNGIFAAAPQIESLRGVEAAVKTPDANRFANSSFHKRINDVYRDGAGLVVAADLERIVAQASSKDTSAEAERRTAAFKQLGVMSLRHFVAEQKDVKGKTLSQAALTFNESNRGIASWLAAPGPMGALDYISPNANVVAAFVVREPALLVDDLLGFLDTADPDASRQLKNIQEQQGFDIRNDFAAPLGGEFAFAIDGPILPTPSWKMVLEVYDQAKLQNTFERAVEKLNQFSALHGKGKMSIVSSTAGGATYYKLSSDKGGPEVHYTYSNGYLIAAPSRALLEQSVAGRANGNTLVRSSRFIASLPQDGNANFSAVFYHDLAGLVGPLAERMKNAAGSSTEQGKALASIDANAAPTLAYVYAQGDRITVAANTEGGAFGLSPASLIGLPNSFQMQHILMNAMGDKDVQKKSE